MLEEAIATTITVCENSNSFNTGIWCNGNTTVFGAVIIGSNPIIPTNINPIPINIFVTVSKLFGVIKC